uniref:Uncharacterized protein n=1 Tax=Arundo donax TaxID=35708 RepID=A0A0A9HNJ0_ARUDO
MNHTNASCAFVYGTISN